MNNNQKSDKRINQNNNQAQQAIIELVDSGIIQGTVLEVNSGTGENSLHISGAGFPTLGIVLDENEFIQSRQKAQMMLARRGMCARFMQIDPLKLDSLNEEFYTIIDTHFVNTLILEDKSHYLELIHRVLEPGGSFILLLPKITHENILNSELQAIEWSDQIVRSGFFIDQVKSVGFSGGDDDEMVIPGWVIILKKEENTNDR
jgi:SAM-dependent methyltransferase